MNALKHTLLGTVVALTFCMEVWAASTTITSAGGDASATVNDSGTFSSMSFQGVEFSQIGYPLSYYWLTGSSGSFLADNGAGSNPLLTRTSAGDSDISITKNTNTLSFLQVISLTDTGIQVSLTLKNNGTTALSGIKFAVGIDPDQDVPGGGSYATSNSIDGQGADASVTASGLISRKNVTLYNTTMAGAFDVKAYVGNDCCTPVNASSIFAADQAVGNYGTADSFIALGYNIGTVKAGKSAVISYEYLFTATPVPEPETYTMLIAGLGLMGVISRRRSRKAV